MKHTLQAAIDAGAKGIALYCITCPNSTRLRAETALKLWSPDLTFPEIAQKSRCRQCGREASAAAPQWPTFNNIRNAPPLVPAGWEKVSYDNPRGKGPMASGNDH
ncbi:MAG: hypothetical protein QM759_08505 [Terricaulis sp.]